ncbi:anti-sigma factor family protein [Desertibacillus haloalkaliphilus]|uniref:anti-sigma factor family protein n=1 Tax=Desertibacillus haloalkaliphilus TaxID=1328930 RepID=UPI001C279806|nr:anti-sigma factor [Desertibacillus haloalkaliphilus]MBU8908805.1 anti-sigma factor [Desertibacillus haloalkaliphilus]
MSCKKQYHELIHKYLDEEMSEQESKQLIDHLQQCNSCNQHYQELKKSIAFVQSSSHIEAPIGFTEQVMKQLPNQKKSTNWKVWVKKHPFLVAVSVFLLLISTSVFSLWSDPHGELVVTGAANVQIDQDGSTVIVPEDEVIEGDLVIRNGRLEVEGEVKGNIVLINSEQYLASAGTVSGEIEEIDQMLEWVWYHTKSFFTEVITVFERDRND